eukprot:12160861-Karenia_brevis.AAC.1
MFQCGVSLGLCRLMMAAFDVTTAVVKIGRLLGRPFAEKMGVREGAVESPHLFNVYIGDLRKRLEEAHARLCKLLHVTIA